MAEYITKEAAKGVINHNYPGFRAAIDALPAADVVPTSALRTLRDDLYENDLISIEGLRQLNALIAMHEGGGDNG